MTEFSQSTQSAVGGSIVDETGVRRTVNRAFVNPTAGGNTEIVAAQAAGIRIRVIAAAAIAASAVSVKFQSATTDISATYALAANGGFVLPDNVSGWFQTSAAEALNINLSAGVNVGCNITWVAAT